LAERSGVSLGSLKRFEQNGQISFENLLKLAQILGQLEAFEHLFAINDQTKEVEQLFSKKARGL
jgi:transcriptional regulator with XRE-family HTH domain